MERRFTLSCCSTVDLPYSYMADRGIPVLFYTYIVDGKEYVDDMGRDPQALPRFYRFLEEGKLPQTSQINVGTYLEFFEELLQKGDLLHIAFTSGQSGSVHNAMLAAEELKEKYPDRKIIVIDSLCSSSGYGMLVDTAADMRDEGKSIDELEKIADEKMYLEKNRYYREKGIDRRGQKIAYDIICETYAKILKINLTDDSYQIIKINDIEKQKENIVYFSFITNTFYKCIC